MVRHTLKRFEDLRRKLLRDAESRSDNSGIVVKRPDFKAASILKASALYLNQEKRVGHVPGIEVGDQFYFRIELCIVGLHRPLQAGIDAIHAKDSEYGIPVAASIVASGGYEDDLDTGETLIYTGQGGNNYKGDRRQQKHQRLEKGNLALANSCRKGLPVRLIRGCNDTGSSPTGKIYSYDGLYKVARFWLDMGLSGYGVYKFQLHRLPGQPPLGSALVQFMGKLKTTPSGREAMILKDISNGAEKLPLCVVNTVDRSPEAPADFRYIASIVYPSTILRPSAPKGCQCKDGCFDPFVCRCIRKNSGELPYTHDGALVELKNVVYECGEQCQCPPSCHTRVSQHGQKHRLEIFKTDRKGWGVRSWDSIPSGSFLCEYMGELISSEDAENLVGDDEYLFDLDCIKGNEARGVKLSLFNEDAGRTCEEASLAINARKLGNVGRFINHSCSPNLFVQCVLYDHHDLRIPHIMLFAMENIRPLKELTYDYAYVVGTVIDADGKVKSKACHCGAKRCRGRLY
ncbi:hypothetical protein O6H91_12G065100 [Diphasiastrum complanatum]|nr:hypothetical protein O6H91_12G065100 [Diphasiastrum complanatum]